VTVEYCVDVVNIVDVRYRVTVRVVVAVVEEDGSTI